MKNLSKSLLAVATFVFLLSSCINSDYDYDNIDTTAEFRIPPIMLGSIERIKLAELPAGNLPPDLELPDLSIVKSYILDDLFGEEMIDRFFFEGATVEIEARSVNVGLPLSDATIDLFFNVLDIDGEPLSGINIPQQRLSIGQNQNLLIKLDAQSMPFMSDAQGLEMILVISGPAGATVIDSDSYLELNDVIVRTSGIRFEL